MLIFAKRKQCQQAINCQCISKMVKRTNFCDLLGRAYMDRTDEAKSHHPNFMLFRNLSQTGERKKK